MKNYISSSANVSPLSVIGENNIIGHGVIIHDNVTIGNNNHIGAYSIIGAPAEIKGNEQKISGRVIIGNGNVIREFVSINSPERKKETRIGDRCYIMNKAHIGHDCIIEDDVIIAALSSTGGVCTVKKFAFLGQGVILRGRLIIGESTMIGAGSVVTHNVPDYQTWYGNPARWEKFNLIGLKRRGFTNEQIEEMIQVKIKIEG